MPHVVDPMPIEGVSHDVIIFAMCVVACWVIIIVAFGPRVWRMITGRGNANAAGAGGNVAGRTTNTDCPICLEPVTEETGITTLCDHSYCTPCWVAMAQRQRAQRGRWIVNCAYCRRDVTLLQRFSARGDDAARAVVAAYNARAATHRWPWVRAVRDAPLLLRRLARDFTARPWRVIGLLIRTRRFVWCVGAVLYVLSPFDLIPEAVFGLVGIIDDLFVVGVLLVVLGVCYRAVLLARTGAAAARNGGGRPPTAARAGGGMNGRG